MTPIRDRLRAGLIPVLSISSFLTLVEMVKYVGLLPVTVPAPSAVLRLLMRDPEAVIDNLLPTLRAAGIGFSAAAITAIGLATVATLIKRTKPLIYNLAVLTYSIPLLALSPVLVVWFGNGPAGRIVISALAGFFPILVGAMQGFSAIDPRQSELFHSLAASPWQRFRLLALPSALGFIFSGMKIAAASAVLGAIVAEWAGAERGLGVMMAYALFAFNVDQVWLAMLVTVVCALGCYGLVLGAERILMPWNRSNALQEAS